jgi:hypothetical protein
LEAWKLGGLEAKRLGGGLNFSAEKFMKRIRETQKTIGFRDYDGDHPRHNPRQTMSKRRCG